MDTTLTPTGFAGTGISTAMLDALVELGIVQPTAIQEQAIPVAMRGSDLIGIAQTGTGKTLAFAAPIIEKLRRTGGNALILAPTRELALQIEEVIRVLASKLKPRITTAVLIGGAPIYRQTSILRTRPRLIIATPGRLQDHINQGNVSLANTETLIMDEADRMLDMGFLGQIERIIGHLPSVRQTLLFSATMSSSIRTLTENYLTNPIIIEIAPQGTAAELIDQHICYVDRTRKSDVLHDLLGQHTGPTLVFSRTKHGASKLTRVLQDSGFDAAEIHADRSLGQRQQALHGFKTGRYRVLVATDVASRGIDVDDIALVVNYDLPDAPSDYVHRIGRTGRAGKSGIAISLACHDQYDDVRAIERLTGHQLSLSEHSEPVRVIERPSQSYNRNRSRRPQQGGWRMPARRGY
jgi:ATP-dependent RNA helicase RhlE